MPRRIPDPERNEVDYAFNTLKARLTCNRTQVHSTEAWEGKFFLQKLATAINAMVRARVKLYNEGAVTKSGKKKYRVHYDSDHKLLGQLNNVYITRFKDGWIFDKVAGKKKELFRILNVPLPTCEQVITSDDQLEDPDENADIEDIAAETLDPEVVEL